MAALHSDVRDTDTGKMLVAWKASLVYQTRTKFAVSIFTSSVNYASPWSVDGRMGRYLAAHLPASMR